jgi:hypothetical protein
MPRRWKSLLLVPVLSALLLTSCDPGAPGAALDSPTAPSLTESLGDYTLVQAAPLSSLLQTVQLIGPGGGSLSLAGHALTVPAGAVSAPTLFSMAQLPNGLIEVELSAVRGTLLGIIDIGSGGFLGGETVGVTLSYDAATNVSDPSRLVVLRMLGDDQVEEIPTAVDQGDETVQVELEHFSRYAMAID